MATRHFKQGQICYFGIITIHTKGFFENSRKYTLIEVFLKYINTTHKLCVVFIYFRKDKDLRNVHMLSCTLRSHVSVYNIACYLVLIGSDPCGKHGIFLLQNLLMTSFILVSTPRPQKRLTLKALLCFALQPHLLP